MLCEIRGDAEKAEEYRIKAYKDKDTLLAEDEDLSTLNFLYEWFIDLSHIDQNYTDQNDILNVVQKIESVFGNKSVVLVDILVTSSHRKIEQGDFSSAEVDLRKANEIAISTAGKMSLPTARTYLGLGELFYEQKLISEAEEYLLHAVSKYSSSLFRQ